MPFINLFYGLVKILNLRSLNQCQPAVATGTRDTSLLLHFLLGICRAQAPPVGPSPPERSLPKPRPRGSFLPSSPGVVASPAQGLGADSLGESPGLQIWEGQHGQPLRPFVPLPPTDVEDRQEGLLLLLSRREGSIFLLRVRQSLPLKPSEPGVSFFVRRF